MYYKENLSNILYHDKMVTKDKLISFYNRFYNVLLQRYPEMETEITIQKNIDIEGIG